MRLPILALAIGLAGCSAPQVVEEAPEEQVLADAPPPIPILPHTDRASFDECPYLNTQWVADTNGQRVTGVGIDPGPDGVFDPPACQFWSYPEEPQLTVFVRRMPTPEQAMAVVDWAAPVEFTDPADQPEGWNGGRHGGGAVPGRIGAAYSVAKGPVAVTVFTNQDESIKAQLVAEEVITNLGL